MLKIVENLLPLIWIALWFFGGVLIVLNLFKVKKHETTLLGFGLGLILQVWISNWIGQLADPLTAFWISSIIILLIGLIITLAKKSLTDTWKYLIVGLDYWFVLLIFVYIFFIIGCGLAIFDDYQNLPMTSYIAAGSIPPKFVLNPEVSFDYHYLMLLNAAQWMRIADIFPWTALDLSRGIFFGLTLIYVAFLGRRITFNKLAGWVSAFFVAFAGGARWILLFFPENLINVISANISLMGSGLGTAENLKKALISYWAVEGAGPIQFPFAFGNGYHTIAVMEHDGTGLMGTALALIIILLYQKWKNKVGLAVISILISAMALIDEIWFVFFISAAFLYFLILYLQKGKQNKKQILLLVIFICVIPVVFALIQGGVITGIFNGFVSNITNGKASSSNQYYSLDFPIRWPPAFISAHLGILSLTKWTNLLVVMLEVGPILLMIPLFIYWGWKAFQRNSHIFSILTIAVLESLLMVFVEYQGSAGISASKRLTIFATDLLILFSIPIIWVWVKDRSNTLKIISGLLLFITMVGGIVNFAIESVAIQEPVFSYFINHLDASTQNKFWNRLNPDERVFDQNPSRSATIFARPLESNITWYENTPEYQELSAKPYPYQLAEKGYTHVYWSRDGWNQLSENIKTSYDEPCVRKIHEEEDVTGDFRWLMDISACKK
jgi:hypothetical protein